MSFAGHGHGSDSKICSFPDWLKKFDLCNRSKNWDFIKQTTSFFLYLLCWKFVLNWEIPLFEMISFFFSDFNSYIFHLYEFVFDMIVSNAQQNLPCKICIGSYQFASKCNYNCKYCSSKSSLQTLHEFWRYIFIAFEWKCNCKYCLALSEKKATFMVRWIIKGSKRQKNLPIMSLACQ